MDTSSTGPEGQNAPHENQTSGTAPTVPARPNASPKKRRRGNSKKPRKPAVGTSHANSKTPLDAIAGVHAQEPIGRFGGLHLVQGDTMAVAEVSWDCATVEWSPNPRLMTHLFGDTMTCAAKAYLAAHPNFVDDVQRVAPGRVTLRWHTEGRPTYTELLRLAGDIFEDVSLAAADTLNCLKDALCHDFAEEGDESGGERGAL